MRRVTARPEHPEDTAQGRERRPERSSEPTQRSAARAAGAQGRQSAELGRRGRRAAPGPVPPGPTHPWPPAPPGFGRFLRRLRQDSGPPSAPASARDKYRFRYSALESGGAAAMAAAWAGRRVGALDKIPQRKATGAGARGRGPGRKGRGIGAARPAGESVRRPSRDGRTSQAAPHLSNGATRFLPIVLHLPLRQPMQQALW